MSCKYVKYKMYIFYYMTLMRYHIFFTNGNNKQSITACTVRHIINCEIKKQREPESYWSATKRSFVKRELNRRNGTIGHANTSFRRIMIILCSLALINC